MSGRSKATTGRLWDKGGTLHSLVDRFTVGDDYLLDERLATADCVATLAHVQMLHRVNLLSGSELAELREALGAATADARAGRFSIAPDDEDVHTALERYLTQRTDAGAKVHTGRSRNDQVMAALRLYGREALLAIQGDALSLSRALCRLAGAHPEVPMPGRTHLQPAMPSSVALWAQAFAEELLDDVELLEGARRLTDRSPLGSAAGYGVPLPLDRELVANSLAFEAVHHNVLAASNARGKLEAVTLDALEQLALTLSRLAQDLMLFSLIELGYFALPPELCTGSSIMPQKRNPDALELVRAKAATLHGYGSAVKGLLRAMPSGYHRDLQESKRPFLLGLADTALMTQVMIATVSGLRVNEAALGRAMTPELMATDRAYQLVRTGLPFRAAYRRVAEELAAGAASAEWAAVGERSATGAAENLNLTATFDQIALAQERVAARESQIASALEELAGAPVYILGDSWPATAPASRE